MTNIRNKTKYKFYLKLIILAFCFAIPRLALASDKEPQSAKEYEQIKFAVVAAQALLIEQVQIGLIQDRQDQSFRSPLLSNMKLDNFNQGEIIPVDRIPGPQLTNKLNLSTLSLTKAFVRRQSCRTRPKKSNVTFPKSRWQNHVWCLPKDLGTPDGITSRTILLRSPKFSSTTIAVGDLRLDENTVQFLNDDSMWLVFIVPGISTINLDKLSKNNLTKFEDLKKLKSEGANQNLFTLFRTSSIYENNVSWYGARKIKVPKPNLRNKFPTAPRNSLTNKESTYFAGTSLSAQIVGDLILFRKKLIPLLRSAPDESRDELAATFSSEIQTEEGRLILEYLVSSNLLELTTRELANRGRALLKGSDDEAKDLLKTRALASRSSFRSAVIHNQGQFDYCPSSFYMKAVEPLLGTKIGCEYLPTGP